jgi:FMN phosphatase YigB (HAD superfamily)
MVRVVVLDLGGTLTDGTALFPHVPEALTALRKLRRPDGSRLELCLVSDFTMPNGASVRTLFSDYLRILDRLCLRRFFLPVGRHVTLSTHAGVMKPDRRVYELALERLGTGANLGDCLAITEQAAHVAACRKLGMAALRFGTDFTDWSDAPSLVQELATGTPPSEMVDEAAVLRRSLEQHGQLAESTDEPLAPGVTHVVETDDQGSEVLRRKRFSAI